MYGVLADIIVMKAAVYFGSSYSIVGGIIKLFQSGDALIAIVIILFSIVVPVLKVLVIFRALTLRHSSRETVTRYVGLIHKYGRWSFLDVLVVAVLVAAVKMGVLATVETKGGLYAFLAAVILIVILTSIVTWRLERVKKH